MKPIIWFTVAVLMAGKAVCQIPADVKGWGKIEWGMTVQQAKTAYGAQAEDSSLEPAPAPYPIDRFTVRGIQIAEFRAIAYVQTKRDSDKVSSVVVEIGSQQDGPRVRSAHFDTAKKLLIEKYGQPKSEDRKLDGDRVNSQVIWTFPSTSITLQWVEQQGQAAFPLGYARINYEAVDKKSLDAL